MVRFSFLLFFFSSFFHGSGYEFSNRSSPTFLEHPAVSFTSRESSRVFRARRPGSTLHRLSLTTSGHGSENFASCQEENRGETPRRSTFLPRSPSVLRSFRATIHSRGPGFLFNRDRRGERGRAPAN